MPDPLAAAVTDHGHAVRALADHIKAAGWNETCPDCLSLLGHVNRTERQIGRTQLDLAGEHEEVPLF